MTPPPIAPDQSEVLLRVVEAAPQVCRRHQFFVWTQGDFQRWLPHKLSLCGSYDREQRDVVFDLFNSLPMPECLTRSLRDRRGALVEAALALWQRGRGQAVVLELSPLASRDPVVAELVELGYERFIVHGLTRPGRADEVESLFLFGRERSPSICLALPLPCSFSTTPTGLAVRSILSFVRSSDGSSPKPTNANTRSNTPSRI